MQSLDEILQDSTTVAVDRLIANADALQAEHDKHEAILDYLNRLKGWKNNTELRVAQHLPILPPPTPPAGYVPVVEAAPVVPTPDFTPMVGDEGEPGIYMAIGDHNPDGTPITYNGLKMIKVGRKSPFGVMYYWQVVKPTVS